MIGTTITHYKILENPATKIAGKSVRSEIFPRVLLNGWLKISACPPHTFLSGRRGSR